MNAGCPAPVEADCNEPLTERDIREWGQRFYERKRRESEQIASVWMAVAEQVKQW